MANLRLNICLIDDDRIYQFTAKKTLESTGLAGQVQVFSNGDEALKFFQTHITDPASLPNVIFLDINMPIMDGWHFLEAFKPIYTTITQQLIIYMVSSSVNEYDIKKSKEYSIVSDYIIKPLNKEKFEQILSKLSQAS